MRRLSEAGPAANLWRMARTRAAPLLTPFLALVGVVVAAGAGRPPAAADPTWPDAPAAQQVPAGFTHRDHEALQCFVCHENTAGHGALTVTTIEDCRACHHAPSSTTTAASCARCHEAAPDGRFEVTRAVAFSVPARDVRRLMAFPHDRHAAIDCVSCHTQGTALAVPADLDCASCHADHHTTTSDCASCHAPVHVTAHPSAEVHVTCSGAACHQDVPFESVPRTRAFCLGCHRDMSSHEAPRDCVDCHILPAPRVVG